MKRNTLIRIQFDFVDTKNGLNSIYKLVHKKIPLVLDVFSREISTYNAGINDGLITIDIYTPQKFETKLRSAFFDAVKNHTILDMSINGIDVIPFSISTITKSILPNGFKPVENIKRFRFV
jgi:hypothetical protein